MRVCEPRTGFRKGFVYAWRWMRRKLPSVPKVSHGELVGQRNLRHHPRRLCMTLHLK